MAQADKSSLKVEAKGDDAGDASDGSQSRLFSYVKLPDFSDTQFDTGDVAGSGIDAGSDLAPPDSCNHKKKGLDPHSLCEACKRKHGILLCAVDSRCDECDRMDENSFLVLMSERNKNVVRQLKKNASPKTKKASMQSPETRRSTRQSPARPDASYLIDDDFAATKSPLKGAKKLKKKASAVSSFASTLNVNPERLQAFLADPNIIASLQGSDSFNPYHSGATQAVSYEDQLALDPTGEVQFQHHAPPTDYDAQYPGYNPHAQYMTDPGLQVSPVSGV